MTKTIAYTILLGAAVFFGTVPTANADFRITIDCHGTGGLPTWPAGDAFGIVVLFNDGSTKDWRMRLDSPECARDDGQIIDYLGAYTVDNIRTISLANVWSTNAVWIDKVKITPRNASFPLRQWGQDDNLGWCLSNGNDYNATYNIGGACQHQIWL
jgi:hypothetical protein